MKERNPYLVGAKEKIHTKVWVTKIIINEKIYKVKRRLNGHLNAPLNGIPRVRFLVQFLVWNGFNHDSTNTLPRQGIELNRISMWAYNCTGT